MNLLIIITAVCIALYKAHAGAVLLDLARMDKAQPNPQRRKTRFSNIEPADRKQAERTTANILLYNGYKGDAFGLVKKMTLEELTEIIERFKDDIGA